MEDVKQLRKKPSKIEEMSKEQIRQAILKKRECNAKAQQIVESLLEKDISEDHMLNCLPHINQSHFDDIIEERCIVKLCGYPLCQNNLSETDIPKQKYRISMKTNKVYDITTRKSFCSNSCYKSAMHIKKQMLTSPLWFREYEKMPKFQLLQLDKVGSLGQEVDVALIERVNVKKEKPFTSINDFANVGLTEITESYEDNIENNKSTEDCVGTSDSKHINEDDNHNSSVINNKSDNKPNIKSGTYQTMQEIHNTTNTSVNLKKQASNPLNIVGEIVEKPEKRIDPILINKPEDATNIKATKKVPKKKQPAIVAITIEVEKYLAEWFTLDTLLFLYGEERVKEMVADKGECIKEYLHNYAKGIFYNSNTYDQYQTLCRKLNMLELEDKRFDSQTLKRETKPLPDYSILQEESKKMQLKVRAFFAGETEIPDIKNIEEKTTEAEDNDLKLTQLPLVDKNAQNALRRKIVCQHLNKVLPDLLRSLGLLTLTVSADVRLLVNTFKLKANNVMFKPIQWTLIAIIFIKLLSVRDRRLEYQLEQPTAFQHMQLLLLSYKQDGGYLERLISWLTDVDRLLDTNDTQLTIE